MVFVCWCGHQQPMPCEREISLRLQRLHMHVIFVLRSGCGAMWHPAASCLQPGGRLGAGVGGTRFCVVVWFERKKCVLLCVVSCSSSWNLHLLPIMRPHCSAVQVTLPRHVFVKCSNSIQCSCRLTQAAHLSQHTLCLYHQTLLLQTHQRLSYFGVLLLLFCMLLCVCSVQGGLVLGRESCSAAAQASLLLFHRLSRCSSVACSCHASSVAVFCGCFLTGVCRVQHLWCHGVKLTIVIPSFGTVVTVGQAGTVLGAAPASVHQAQRSVDAQVTL